MSEDFLSAPYVPFCLDGLQGRNGTSGGLFWADKVSRPMTLCIDDPLRPGANIGAGSFNMFHVQVRQQ